MRFHQDNKGILEGIRELLKELGINSNPVRKYLRKGKERHYFNISGYENYFKYQELIGANHPIKKQRLSNLVTTTKSSKTFRLIPGKTKSEIVLFLKDFPRGATTKEIKQNLFEKYPNLKWNEDTLVRHLKNLEIKRLAHKERRGQPFYWFLSE